MTSNGRPSLRLSVACACAVLLGLGVAHGEGQAPPTKGKERAKLATFKAFVSPVDPFSELNTAKLPAGAKMAFRRGETFVLTIAGSVAEGWHTYPLTRRT